MAFQPAVNIAVCEIRATYGLNVRVENVLHFRYLGAITQEALDDLTEAVAAVVVEDFRPLLPDAIAFSNIYARDLSTQIALESTDVSIGGLNGTAATPALPANATLAISFRTGFTGRSARGRAYVLALPEGQTVDNAVNNTYATAWTTAFAQVGQAALIAGWTWGVLSRVQNKAVLPEAEFYPITNAVVVDFNVDSQRRRLNGRGV